MSPLIADSFAGGTVWEALGTTVVLHVTEPPALRRATRILHEEIEAMDLVASRFRADSELARVNARAGELTAISARMYEALAVALRAARLTDGLLDPSIGGDLLAAGYDRDRSLLTPITGGELAPGPGLPARVRPDWREIRLISVSTHTRAAVLLPQGMLIDLGATAKALIADRAAAAITKATGVGVLVSLGGDIATAGPAPAGGWQVHVTDDHRGGLESPGQTVAISGAALATSSTTTLRWASAGRAMHHILDPRSGLPAVSAWRTVSVSGGSCVDANTASTAAILLGADAPQWLAERSLPARLVAHDGELTTVAGWPQEVRC